MTVKIRVTTCRKEYDTFTHTLTPEKYAEFLELRKSASTQELGEFVESNSIHVDHFDSTGESDGEITSLYNDFEDEYIQD